MILLMILAGVALYFKLVMSVSDQTWDGTGSTEQAD